VRERKSAEKDVAARLRSVLSGSVGDGSVGTPAGEVVGPPEPWPEVMPEVRPTVPPEVRPKAPAEPRPESRPDHGLGDLAELGEPLRWSDIIPAWPDDVDLGPASESSSDEEGRAPPSAALREPTGGFRTGTPWASPPGAPLTPAETIPRAASPTLGEPMKDGLDGVAGNVRRPLPPPNWVLPEEDFEDALASRPAWSAPESDDEPPELTSAGAFGGDRKVGIRAFDPGRRGVRALAGVAAVAILVAALLAWRARPHVDPVAPPSFDAVATTSAASSAGRGGPSTAAAEVVVAVGGKVRKPGLVRLPPGARVADALAAAGGANPGVDVALLNLARKVVDGELIMVGVTPPPGVTTAPAAPAAGGPSAAAGPINLNTATLADLDTLPGVGPVLAQRILDARESQGGFHAVSDLRKVDGIGDARYEQLKDLVTV
jgi:competence protein ComEA